MDKTDLTLYLASILCFAWLLSLSNVPELSTSPALELKPLQSASVALEEPEYVVASVNGEVYHEPHCSYAKRILPENLVYFDSAQEAESAGYREAERC